MEIKYRKLHGASTQKFDQYQLWVSHAGMGFIVNGLAEKSGQTDKLMACIEWLKTLQYDSGKARRACIMKSLELSEIKNLSNGVYKQCNLRGLELIADNWEHFESLFEKI